MAKKKHQKNAPKGNQSIIWKFVFTYVLLMGLFLLLIGYQPVKQVIDINGLYSGMIVYLTALLLSPFDLVQGISGTVIRLQGLALDVKFGCNGLEAFLIYAIGIISFPASHWHKFVGVVGGFVALQALNVLRIAGLALCGIYFKELFHYVHIYIAQGVMIAVAVIFFLIWLNYATKTPNPA